jgi:hypothetical protein
MAVRLNVLAYGVMFLVLARLGNATEYSPTKIAADNAIEDVRLLRRALRNFNSVSRFEPGAGVQPDTRVGPSLVDFLEGKDAVLEMAVSRSIDKP